ncbi:MAG: hypothetical protein EPO36_13895 [Chloroflexota bacterium]|nr:MAG: hypothetical protein EPO36_13895 [Chloroflexota bacterium]
MTQVESIVTLVRDVLGDDLLGAYLHGSAVLGQLRPRSDTDVFVVSRRGLTMAVRRALTDGIMAISGRRAHAGPARPIELTVVVQSEVRPWRYPSLGVPLRRVAPRRLRARRGPGGRREPGSRPAHLDGPGRHRAVFGPPPRRAGLTLDTRRRINAY